jgi:hypothetical protein
VHTWLAWLVRVIWSAARRILGIPQAIDQADYCPFIAYRDLGLVEFPEAIPGDLSCEGNCLPPPAFSRFSLAISEGICEAGAAIQCGLNRTSRD